MASSTDSDDDDDDDKTCQLTAAASSYAFPCARSALHGKGTVDGFVFFVPASPLSEDARKENDVGNSHSNPIASGDTCTFRQRGACAACSVMSWRTH